MQTDPTTKQTQRRTTQCILMVEWRERSKRIGARTRRGSPGWRRAGSGGGRGARGEATAHTNVILKQNPVFGYSKQEARNIRRRSGIEARVLAREADVDAAMLAELEALRRRRARLPLLLPCTWLVLVVSITLVDWGGARWISFWRGERDWQGERRYVPAVSPDRKLVGAIDLARVHERLLPRWGLGLGWGRDSGEEQAAFDALLAEAGKDPNLAQLLTELREAARTDAASHSKRIAYLAWCWNTYLERLDLPWHLESNVQVGPGRNRLLIQTYSIQGQAEVQLETHAIPVLVLQRADHLNLDDGALGRAGVEAGNAQVLASTVQDYATRRVWPLLHQLSAHGTDTDAQFSAAVASEVRRALSPRDFATLARTAPSYRALEMMRASALERHDCGSRLRLGIPPIRGYSEDFRGLLARLAEAELDDPCPAITLDEVATIDLESATLSQSPGLEAALQALTDHLVRGVAIHEARHVADETEAHAFQQPLRCPSCPAALGARARAEVSAYLASFADEATGYTSLHQACRVATGDSTNAVALGFLLPRLLPEGCAGGPPPDLRKRASTLEASLFGRISMARYSTPASRHEGHALALHP